MDRLEKLTETVIKQDKEIERLRKEKEWLLNGWAIMRSKVCPRQYPSAYEKESLLIEMKQALKEGE